MGTLRIARDEGGTADGAEDIGFLGSWMLQVVYSAERASVMKNGC